jgi:hypothetical protein
MTGKYPSCLRNPDMLRIVCGIDWIAAIALKSHRVKPGMTGIGMDAGRCPA